MMERLKSLLSLRPYPRIRSLMDFMRLRILEAILIIENELKDSIIESTSPIRHELS